MTPASTPRPGASEDASPHAEAAAVPVLAHAFHAAVRARGLPFAAARQVRPGGAATREEAALQWVGCVLGQPLLGLSVQEALASGEVLCDLLNALVRRRPSAAVPSSDQPGLAMSLPSTRPPPPPPPTVAPPPPLRLPRCAEAGTRPARRARRRRARARHERAEARGEAAREPQALRRRAPLPRRRGRPPVPCFRPVGACARVEARIAAP